MVNTLRTLVLRVTRVPAEPHPPLGAPGSVRVFRAGKNYYNLRLFGWIMTQVVAVIGFAFSLWFLNQLDHGVTDFRAEALRAFPPAAAAGAPTAVTVAPAETPPRAEAPGATRQRKTIQEKSRRAAANLTRVASHWPMWLFPLLHWLEYGAIFLFICQVPFTLAAVRLDFEQHWYIVTDRSLRIRAGLFSLQETTMSFANLQQVEVKQGPLQRLLGLANVRVQSAGGGGGQPGQPESASLHTGIFHGVDNANEIRDLILERLRRFREAGLGDPEDHRRPPAPDARPTGVSPEALSAAREVLAEARALRQAVG